MKTIFILLVALTTLNVHAGPDGWQYVSPSPNSINPYAYQGAGVATYPGVGTIRAETTGAVLGAMGGAILGSGSNNRTTQIIAPLVGAIGGSMVGNYISNRNNEMHRQQYIDPVQAAYERGLQERYHRQQLERSQEAYERGLQGLPPR